LLHEYVELCASKDKHFLSKKNKISTIIIIYRLFRQLSIKKKQKQKQKQKNLIAKHDTFINEV
ncbi:MAG: hypothetical protein N6V41_00825, partial [Candidatus Portiera aleyrodidarum]|nr:hypothetical protein [Candidatus Portiera aleyrodidarum]